MNNQLPLRPTVLEICLPSVIHNYKLVKDAVRTAKILATIKADGYGHGIVQVAKALEKEKVDYFGVALLQEGVKLRESGVQTPILVFGGILPDEVPYFLKSNLEMTVGSYELLEAVQNAATQEGVRAKVHLKLDTGMGRIGLPFLEAPEFFKRAKDLSMVDVVGVFSHMATSDTDVEFTKMQIEKFQSVKEQFQSISPEKHPIFHLANSSGIFGYPESHFDMVRTGIVLFGECPGFSAPCEEFKLSIRLRSKVVFVKRIKAGDSVSYDRTWIADKDSTIATIPLGYGDGYFRRLSNLGSVLIRGKRYPMVGKVCMDQFMVNLGDDTAALGDEVILIGKQGNELISLHEVAKLIQTADHEIFTSINHRVPRVYL